jgi:uncharacterized protein with NRDE domain
VLNPDSDYHAQMCLILIANQYSSAYPLVIAANRDEFYARATREAGFWSEDSRSADLLAGKDLTMGGTWIGMHRSGRIAAVTNIRDPAISVTGRRSRGQLTVNFLLASSTPLDYLRTVQKQMLYFAGFNLLVGDLNSLAYLNSDSGKLRELEAGIYGLSNGRLDDPWPKVNRGKQQLKEVLENAATLGTDTLMKIMRNTKIAPDSELPQTGVPLELERALSASFISNPERGYGTRCSTAIIVDQGKNVRFSEQNYGSNSELLGRHYYEFTFAELLNDYV